MRLARGHATSATATAAATTTTAVATVAVAVAAAAVATVSVTLSRAPREIASLEVAVSSPACQTVAVDPLQQLLLRSLSTDRRVSRPPHSALSAAEVSSTMQC